MNHNPISHQHMNNLQSRTREEFIRALEAGEYALVDVKSCSQCKSSNLGILAEVDRFGLPFRAEICRDCGLVMTTPRLAEECLPRYYKEVYVPLVFGSQDMRQLMHFVNPKQGKMIYEFCRPTLAKLDKKALTVAEIGCASGHNLHQFSCHAQAHGIACQTIGCEYSEYFKEYAEEKLGIRYVIGGAEEMIELGETVDVLILSHVFEHFVDLQAAKKHLQRILAPEGLLYIEVPGILSLKNKFEYHCDFLRYRIHAHIYDFSLVTLRNVLAPEFVLIDGTEYCHALFRMVQPGDISPPAQNDYNRIRLYLQNLEIYRTEHRHWVQARSLLHRGLRKIVKELHRFTSLV